jgi:hypothetical protein
VWDRRFACPLSLYILVESAKSEVGQTIGLCRLSPLLLEPDRPQKTMVCPTCFHQFSKGVHPHCVQAISLRHNSFSNSAQLLGWNGPPESPEFAGSGLSISRFTTTGSCPLLTTTASQGSSARALISWCGTNGGT